MSESLVIFGKTWTGVNGFKVKDTNDVTKTYIKQDGTVTQNLTNVTSSNQTAVAVGAWSTKLTPPEGYLITSVTVTMGGVDITSSVWTADVDTTIVGKSVTSNGTYTAANDGFYGYSSVDVNVQPSLQDKTATSNGSVTADTGYDGLGTVTVNVQPTLQNKTVTSNGTVTADSGYDGLGTVTVNVSGGGSATLGTKSITANGTYNASSDSLDGYSSVTVNVPSPLETLPSGYTRLNYIQVDGNSWINSEFYAGPDSIIQVDYMSLKNSGDSFQTVIGATASSTTSVAAPAVFFYLASANTITPLYTSSGTATNASTTVINNGDRYLYTLSNTEFKIGNTETVAVRSGSSAKAVTVRMAYPLYIFARNHANSLVRAMSVGRLYSLKIYEISAMVRNYIPCIDVSTGAYGLYETITGTFLGNGGSGTITGS